MAKVDICIGDAWGDEDEGVLVSWLFNNGATVKQGEVIVEVMQSKAQMEIEAPATGTLNVLLAADDVVTRTTVLGTIETE